MKRILILLMTLLLCASAFSCGKSDSVPTEASQGETKIDIDMSGMSTTMAYSQIYNMASDPSKFYGKIVKMKGSFGVYHDDNTGIDYFACSVMDETACCAQSLEFLLKDESLKYPEDYPEIGDEITVTGEFETYNEGSNSYCRLKNATLS